MQMQLLIKLLQHLFAQTSHSESVIADWRQCMGISLFQAWSVEMPWSYSNH